MNEVKKLDRVKAALDFSKHGEGFLDFGACGDDIFYRLTNIGETLCAEMIPGDSGFYLVDSLRKTGGTIHELSTVVIYKGMLNFIFRTASLAAAVTPCPTQAPAEAARPWAQNVAWWLEEGEFYFDDERYWWLQSPDRRSVFDFYAENIFRFVVLHEIGHLHNMHGARRKKPLGRQFPVPAPGLSDGEKNDSTGLGIVDNCSVSEDGEDFSRHIREVVADTYAFQFFLHGLIEGLTEPDSQTDDSDDAANAIKIASVIVALNFVQLYFWLSDAMPSTRTEFVLDGEKYPPHAFRMQVIESALLEHGNRILPVARIQASLEQAMKQTLTISANVAGTEDFLAWRTKLRDPVFFEHYAKICQGVPSWANGVFGVYD